MNCIQLSPKEFMDLALTSVLVISTIFLTIYTYKLVNEARIARKLSVQPHISIYLEHSETEITLLFLIIENTGQGPAYNLKFKIQKDIGEYQGTTKISERGIFKEGMKYCPTSYKKKYFLISTIGDYDKKMDEELIIDTEYDNSFNEKTNEIFRIRLKEQAKSSTLSIPDTYIGRISKNIEDIKKIIEKDKNN